MSELESLSTQELIDRIIELKPHGESGIASDQSRRLLEKVRVHQMELEMQNRELRETRNQLEERYFSLYDHAPVGYITFNPQGAIEELNLAAARLLESNRGDALYQPFERWVGVNDVSIFRGHLQRAFESDEKTVDELTIAGARDHRMLRLESIVVCDGDGTARCQTAMLDITEQKHIEARNRQQQAELAHIARLTTMGEMASSLAHELNQPLGAIALYCQASLRMLRSGGQDQEKLMRALENSAAQAQRAGEIIRRLREFVRKGQSEKSALDLNAVVNETVQFVRVEAGEHRIAMRLELEEALPAVYADRIQIEQVILNLLRNGIEAMLGIKQEQGGLYVRTQRMDDKLAQVSVRDTGPGLNEKAALEALNPFYTTKPDGMGMGLSISRSIIEAHGGRLWTEDSSGGALFHFTLPLAKAAEQGRARAHPASIRP